MFYTRRKMNLFIDSIGCAVGLSALVCYDEIKYIIINSNK